MIKKILIVSRSFYPDNNPRAFRTTELVKEFVRQGHDVTLVFPYNAEKHDVFLAQHKLNIINLGTPIFKQIKIDYSNKYLSLFARLIRRMLQLLIEYPDIGLMFQVQKKIKKLKDFDLLISIAVPYPIHWGTAWARSNRNRIAKTWVADCGDPFMGDRTDSFRKFFYFKYVEKWFMRKANFVAITKETFKVNYYPEFHAKMVEIPQGFNFAEVKIVNKPTKNTPIIFGFAGTLIKDTRDPSKFLDFLCKAKIDFVFVLFTKSKHLVQPYKKMLKEKLVIKDYIPRLELLFELSKMDFLVNFEYDPKVQSPSKLIDYALTTKPILNISNSDFNDETISQFLNRDYSNRFIVENIENYNIKNVTGKFLGLTGKK